MDYRLREAERQYAESGMWADYIELLRQILRATPDILSFHHLIRYKLLVHFNFQPLSPFPPWNLYSGTRKIETEEWALGRVHHLSETEIEQELPMQLYVSEFFHTTSSMYNLHLLAMPGLTQFASDDNHCYDIVASFTMGHLQSNPRYALARYGCISRASYTLFIDTHNQRYRIAKCGPESHSPLSVSAERNFDDPEDILRLVLQLFQRRHEIITQMSWRYIRDVVMPFLMGSLLASVTGIRDQLIILGKGAIDCVVLRTKTQDGFIPIQIYDRQFGFQGPQIAELQIKFELMENNGWADKPTQWRFAFLGKTNQQIEKANYIRETFQEHFQRSFDPQYVEWKDLPRLD